MRNKSRGTALAAIALAATLAGTGFAAPALASSFTDVDDDAYYATAADWANEHKVITGYGNGVFGAEDPLSCYQLATILWRIAKPEEAATYNNMSSSERAAIENKTGLPDVEDGQWFTLAANWAKKNHIIEGYGGTAFGGYDNLSAERFVTILARYADPEGLAATDGSLADSLYADASELSYGKQAAVWARQKGLMSGYPQGDGTYRFGVSEEIVRGRAAKIIYNAAQAGVIDVKETKEGAYTVQFDKNDDDLLYSADGSMSDQTITVGSSEALSANAFHADGYDFAGWNTKPDGTGTAYADKAEVKDLADQDSSVTLYAQWKPTTYTVTYDLEGGTIDGHGNWTDTFTVEDFIMSPQETPTREGFTFLGWTLSDWPADSEPVEEIGDNALTRNITFVAHWQES